MTQLIDQVFNRRRLLQLGVAGVAITAAPGWLGALADTIADADISKTGPVVKMAKKFAAADGRGRDEILQHGELAK